MKGFGKSLLAVITAAAIAFSGGAVRADESDGDSKRVITRVICDNVSINGIDVSGLNYDEALEKVSADAADSGETAITLRSDYGEISTTLGDLGFTDNAESVVYEATILGNSGNVLKRYKDMKELGFESVNLISERYISAAALDAVVKDELGSDLAQNSDYVLMKHDDGTVTVTAAGSTVLVDSEGTAGAINDYLNTEWAGEDIVSTLLISGESGDVESLVSEIHDLLGTFTTDYNGPTGRMGNVERAADFMNGHVLFPGEQISVHSTVSPITIENGYHEAHVYQGNQVIDGIGGGVCQVSTTLYNAALEAELEIVQRNNHSLTVSYVPAAMDAAIAGGILDLRLRNNLDAPIYLEAYYSGGKLTFNIWGKETRPANRTLKFESIVTGTTDPGEPEYEENPALPAGTERQISGATSGKTAQLWKYVYVDGTLTDSILINTSTYLPVKAKIERNSGAAAVGETPGETPETPADTPSDTPDTPDTPVTPDTPATETAGTTPEEPETTAPEPVTETPVVNPEPTPEPEPVEFPNDEGA